MESISTALCAYGMSGSVFHGPLLSSHPGFFISKVWERKNKRVQQYLPEVPSVNTYEDILQDDSIELVIVNTPEHTHFDFARRALEAGKHVVVEKAFTVNDAEAQQLIQLAGERDLVLSVFQNRRWDSDFLTVRKILDQQLLGRLVSYEVHYDRYRNFIQAGTWKERPGPGKGVLYNLGSHLIDQALVLFGLPEDIYARLGIQRTGGQIEDEFELLMGYHGLSVTLKVSYLVREPGPKYALHGTEGSFLKYGMDIQEEALKKGDIPEGEKWGKEPEACWGTLNTSIDGLHFHGKIESLAGNYRAYYDNIYHVIRENGSLIVTPDQAARVIQVIEAAYESHSQKRAISLSS